MKATILMSLMCATATTGCVSPPDLETRLAEGGLESTAYFRHTGKNQSFVVIGFSVDPEPEDCFQMSFPSLSVTVDGDDAAWGSVETDEGGAGGPSFTGGGTRCSGPHIEVNVTDIVRDDTTTRHDVVFNDRGSRLLAVQFSPDEGPLTCEGVLPCEPFH